MDIAKRGATIFVVLMAFAVFLAGGCKAAEKDCVEYRAEDIAYYRGDSCLERYLLYEEDGTYERYIGGTYCGMELPGRVFGTLFEMGTYKESPGVSGEILFTSKKQYNPDTKELENLGRDSETRKGKISGNILTVKYYIKADNYHFFGGYYDTVEHEYKRRT